MEPVKQIRSKTVVMPNVDIDTDQIIPARFLTTTTKLGLGKQLFFDWRYAPDGSDKPDFVLNRPESRGAAILVGGHNFGCGSSREHAPWALLDFGIRVVVSTEIADIFRNNSLKNGLVPVLVDPPTNEWLLANPGADVTIDLATTTLSMPNGKTYQFPLEPFAKYCLTNGVDELGFLLSRNDEISAYERQRVAA